MKTLILIVVVIFTISCGNGGESGGEKVNYDFQQKMSINNKMKWKGGI